MTGCVPHCHSYFEMKIEVFLVALLLAYDSFGLGRQASSLREYAYAGGLELCAHLPICARKMN